MIQSQIYQIKDFWRNATADISEGFEQNSPIWNERFDLCNRACWITQANLADVIAEDYVDDTALNVTGGNYSSASGTFTLATLDIAISMHSSFTAGDIGKSISYRIGTTIYTGKIATVVGAGEITITSLVLPSGNGTVADLLVVGAPVGASASIDISSLLLLPYGSELLWQVVSDATQSVNFVDRETFTRFTPSYYPNLNLIIWTLAGSKILFNQGNNLASLGNLILRAPLLCKKLSADTDYIGLIDGAMAQIGIAVLKNLIMQRIPGLKPAEDTHSVASQIEAVYKSRGQQIKEADVADKVKALIPT
jgi:hypothetical protein